MKVEAGNGCWLTESYEVPISDRRFEKWIIISQPEELDLWKEITDTEKEKITVQAQLFEVEDVDYEFLGKVDVMLSGISEKINGAGLTAAQALENKRYFPKWEDEIGNEHYAGYRFQHIGTLFEVIQPHAFSEQWVPGSNGVESLYKVVQEEHEGTKDDPIPWQHNMELFNGKYYTDKGVLYLCIRDSGIALSYDLADLVSGGYVEEVTEEQEQPEEGSGEDTGDGEETKPEHPEEPDGTLENPIPYTAGKTELMKDKYYTEDGVTYLCIQSAGVQAYKLSEIPAIAQKVEEENNFQL